jgi:putative membrane protein
MTRHAWAGLATSVCLLAFGAIGCSGAGHRPAIQSLGPRGFLEEVASHSAAETQLSREALGLVDHEPVRDFAERMAEDHSRIEREAVEALRQIEPGASAQIDPAQRKVVASLTSKEGCRFEADYLACVISDHEALIGAFEEQARSGEHPSIRSFAERNLPTLRKHLEEARTLFDEVGGELPRTPMPPPTVPSMRIGM